MNYHNITKEDMLNGDGLRVVLWTAGCGHHCKGCHNPQTWDPSSGIEFNDEAKKELFLELEKDYTSGITFSGGDPLFESNVQTITKLAKEIRQEFPKKTIWLYTGFLFEQVKHLETMKYIDVLCDGKFELEKRDVKTPWVGSTNQRVIDVQKSLESGTIVLH